MNSKLKEIAKLLGIKEDNNNSSKLMDACITQLHKIPYIPYPISLHTIDIIPFKESDDTYTYDVLLGRKEKDRKFCIIGGFVDAGETAEEAAKRELKEEAGLVIDIDNLNYKGTFVIDDERFITSSHKISTSFYDILIDNKCQNIIAGDDIVEVKWFEIQQLFNDYKLIILKKHWNLFETFYNQYWSKK